MTPPKSRIQIETEVREAWYQKFKNTPGFDADEPSAEMEWEQYKMLAEALGEDSYEAKWVATVEKMTPEEMQAYRDMLDRLGLTTDESNA